MLSKNNCFQFYHLIIIEPLIMRHRGSSLTNCIIECIFGRIEEFETREANYLVTRKLGVE